jgi:hypothetical protein
MQHQNFKSLWSRHWRNSVGHQRSGHHYDFLMFGPDSRGLSNDNLFQVHQSPIDETERASISKSTHVL